MTAAATSWQCDSAWARCCVVFLIQGASEAVELGFDSCLCFAPITLVNATSREIATRQLETRSASHRRRVRREDGAVCRNARNDDGVNSSNAWTLTLLRGRRCLHPARSTDGVAASDWISPAQLIVRFPRPPGSDTSRLVTWSEPVRLYCSWVRRTAWGLQAGFTTDASSNGVQCNSTALRRTWWLQAQFTVDASRDLSLLKSMKLNETEINVRPFVARAVLSHIQADREAQIQLTDQSTRDFDAQ